MKNSIVKGKVGEREVAELLRSHGFEARRGVQYQGGKDSPDVVCEELSDFHLEVKRTERLQLFEAMNQAIKDSGGEKIPVVMHRKNRSEWLTVLRAEDFLSLVKELKQQSNAPKTGQ